MKIQINIFLFFIFCNFSISQESSSVNITPITNSNLQAAIDLWDNYESVAMIEYGHITDWD
ncbi:MAG: hypothetical protein CMP78_07295, partial [Formosa sp.]|nr:hypothetical protein [Formosa sp.]